MKTTIIMPLQPVQEDDVFLIGDVNILAGLPKSSRITMQPSLGSKQPEQPEQLNSGYIFLDLPKEQS